MNEAGVGAGLKAAGIPRDKLFVTTKVVGTTDQDVHAALSTSLEKLGLDYVDLYLVHMPVCAGSPEGLQKIWAQVEAVKTAGKAKSIGVSNFEQDDLEIILKTATISPAVNQVEFHPYLQHAELLKFHRQHNIATAAYSPLSAVTLARPGPVDDTLAELSQKYGVTEGDVALRWVLDQEIITITTSKSAQRLQSYADNLAQFKLTSEEVQKISELGAKKHFQGPSFGTLRLLYCSPNLVFPTSNMRARAHGRCIRKLQGCVRVHNITCYDGKARPRNLPCSCHRIRDAPRTFVGIGLRHAYLLQRNM
jgi:diketogulonate reductase-like aldo/keto reductase